MVRLSVIFTAIFVVAGCNTTPKTHVINGKEYLVNEQGQIEIARGDLNKSIAAGEVQYISDQEYKPHIKLDEDEFAAASVNNDALFNMLGIKAGDEQVLTLIKKGSLKDNLQRVVDEQNWEHLFYEGPDLYVERPYVVKGTSLESVMNEILTPYEVFLCFDDIEKSVTVIRIN